MTIFQVVNGGTGVAGNLNVGENASISGSLDINSGVGGTNSRKLVLFSQAQNANQFMGMGTEGGALRFQVNASGENFRFYRGNNASSSTRVAELSGNGVLRLDLPTESTNTTNGTLVVSGGAGISGNVNIGGNLNVTGNINGTLNTINSSNATITNNLAVNGTSNLNSVLASGDSAFAGNLNVNGVLSCTNSETNFGLVNCSNLDCLGNVSANTGFISELTLGNGGSALSYFEDKTVLTVSVLVPFATSPQNIRLIFQRLGSRVTMQVANAQDGNVNVLSGTISQNSFILGLGVIPPRFRPSTAFQNINRTIHYTQNNVLRVGICVVESEGILSIFNDQFTSFTGIGQSLTIPTFSVDYFV